MVRFLPAEAAQVTVRSLPKWRSKYVHLMMRRGRKIAKVGNGAETGCCPLLDVAQGVELRAVTKFGSHAGQLATGDGVQPLLPCVLFTWF